MDVTVIVQSDAWQAVDLAVSAVLERVAQHLHIDTDRAVAVVLTSDADIQRLNRDFRAKDAPTNVLSFPSDEPDEWGDIILAYETIVREADAQGKLREDHFNHLLVHGFLHLLGYDHATESEAEEMESLESAILAQLGIANPYQSP